MAASRRLIRIGVVAVVGLAVLVLSPMFEPIPRPKFGADELRAAIEGTWRLTVRDESGATGTVTFRLAQGSAVEDEHASAHTLVRPAAACGKRTLVRSAGACKDITRMPLEVTLIAEDGERRQPAGELTVVGLDFTEADLRVGVRGLWVSANVTPAGEVRSVSSGEGASRVFASTLVRIAR